LKKINPPILILNYKTYLLATGKKALNISKIADIKAKEYSINIIIVPQFTDIYLISQEVDIPVFSQHVDPVLPGKSTGHITIEAIKEAGAVGSLLNHAERKISYEIAKKTYDRMKEFGMIACICAESVEKAKQLAKISPEFIAFEIPELIGTGKSISKFSPDKVRESVEQVSCVNKNVIPLTGAGISDGDDVYASLKLGAKGALVASAFANSKTPEKVLDSMCKAIIKYLEES